MRRKAWVWCAGGLAAVVGLAAAGCGGRSSPTEVQVTDGGSRTIAVDSGQVLAITLGTVGPGQYAVPPDVAGSAVRFVDEAVVAPYTPGGPRQRFRFESVARGQSIVTFTHTGSGPLVQDTVVVR